MSDPDATDALIEAAAPLLGIALQPEWRPAIRAHLEISLAQARLVAAFALPDDAEPAPVFHP